jgi:hypothetical protein
MKKNIENLTLINVKTPKKLNTMHLTSKLEIADFEKREKVFWYKYKKGDVKFFLGDLRENP